MKGFWDKFTSFVVDTGARIALLVLALVAIVLTVGLLVAKFRKEPFKEEAIRKHNKELRDRNATINEYSANRVEEIRQELIEKEVEEIWNLWGNTFKKPRG